MVSAGHLRCWVFPVKFSQHPRRVRGYAAGSGEGAAHRILKCNAYWWLRNVVGGIPEIESTTPTGRHDLYHPGIDCVVECGRVQASDALKAFGHAALVVFPYLTPGSGFLFIASESGRQQQRAQAEAYQEHLDRLLCAPSKDASLTPAVSSTRRAAGLGFAVVNPNLIDGLAKLRQYWSNKDA